MPSIKPNVDGLRKETTIEFLQSNLDSYTPNYKDYIFNKNVGGTAIPQGIFMYTRYGNYVGFKTTRKIRIWGYPSEISDSGGNALNRAKILKQQDDGTYKEFRLGNKPTSYEWYDIAGELEPGCYRFMVGENNYCGWSEWYVEDLSCNYIIKMDDKFYTIENHELSEITDTITAEVIIEKGISINILNENLGLLHGKIKLYSNDSEVNYIKGIKTNSEMIVANGTIPTTVQSNIDYFENKSKAVNGEIKIVFSIDGGNTWKTYNGSEIVNIEITIPNKSYNELNNDELLQWNTAKELIYRDGIDFLELKNINFNTLNMENIKFAYVLHVNNANDIAINQKLIWQFDAKGSMEIMNPTDIKVEVLQNIIKITPKTSEDLIKVNITNGTCTGSSSAQDQDLTDEEIKTFVSEILK